MSLILGFDAGGTFTDSVVFNTETKKIISSGKALTTNFDLSQGIKKSLNMLEKANNLRSNDPYITDSLGWAFFKLKRYHKKKIVELIGLQKFPPCSTTKFFFELNFFPILNIWKI